MMMSSTKSLSNNSAVGPNSFSSLSSSEKDEGSSEYDFSNQQVDKFVLGNLIIKRVQSSNDAQPSGSSPCEKKRRRITKNLGNKGIDDTKWMNINKGENEDPDWQEDDNPDCKRICRLCMKEAIDAKNIFKERLADNVPIALAILACIYPIEISLKDPLSKYACSECMKLLSNYFKFRSCVLRNDRIQRERLGLVVNLDSEEECSEQKRRLEAEIEPYTLKKRKTSDIDGSARSKSRHPPPPKSSVSPTQTKTLNHVEKTLRRILKKTLTPEQQEAENIIIHVSSDLSEVQSETFVDDLHTEKERKTVTPGMKKLIEGSKPEVISKENNTNRESKSKYESTIGLFPSISVLYVFNTSFCTADEYLLEYRLVKGNSRYLRCAVTNCSAVGTQQVIKPGLFSDTVNITKPHNHSKPTEAELKKQMFFCVMRKKLQNDKGLNFRSLYDEICKLDPEIAELVSIHSLINEICHQKWTSVTPVIGTFEQFYDQIESDAFHKIHFTMDGSQFYQEKLMADDNSQAVIFANFETTELVSDSKLMYVDCSFKIDTAENFTYHLLTVLVWIQDSYYPIMFALLSQKSQSLYKNIFTYLRDVLMPNFQPEEIVTDYEAHLYYALGETFINSNIGGSAFYFTQNIYKEICTLNLCRDLETNSYFRNIYHMLLMLPLLPMNTILDGLNNIEIQARDLGLQEMVRPVFDHVRNVWIRKVTPELFCVHRMEPRINENVVAPFKRLRDFLMLSKGKSSKRPMNIVRVVERIIEVENFLRTAYFLNQKKWLTRDLSCAQKKSVLKAWQFIESHPKININNFFTKVLGYIKCMENQLWIWGFYRFSGGPPDELIDASNFSIVSTDEVICLDMIDKETSAISEQEGVFYPETLAGIVEGGHQNVIVNQGENVVMEAVVDENGTFILPETDDHHIDPTLLSFISNDVN